MSPSYLLAEVLKLNPGFVIEMRGLFVSRLGDGKYLLSCEIPEKACNQTFTNPHTAAEHFLAKRKELELGYDYDVADHKQKNSELHIG